MKKVLVADSISEKGLELLREQAQVDIRTGLKPDELAAVTVLTFSRSGDLPIR